VVNAYALSFGWLLLLGGPGWGPAGPPPGVRRRAQPVLGRLSRGRLCHLQAWLLAARAAQGIGSALIAPATLALIVTTFAEARHGTGR
jgi:MFS family permease